MAGTLGEVFSFPLPGTGDAAMVRPGLPSSRVVWRSRRAQWRVTKTVIPGAQSVGQVGRAVWGNQGSCGKGGSSCT